MATVKQELSANVRFGGTIDPGWTKSVSGLERGITSLTRQSAKLTGQQQKLAKEIRKGTLAGKNVSALKTEYSRLGEQISRTRREQEKLNTSLDRRRRLERFTGGARNMMGAGMKKGGALAGGIARWGAAGLTGGLAAAALSPVLLSDMAADRKAQSDKLGVSIEDYMAQEVLGNAIGLTPDAFSEIKNQYLKHEGNYQAKGKDRGLQMAFGSLGFGENQLAGKNDQQRYEYVLDALAKVEDNATRTASAMALLGPEGAKLVNVLRDSGRGYREQIDEQKRYTSLSAKGAAGAAAFNDAMFKLRIAFTSGLMQASGLMGSELAPKVEQLAGQLGSWFKDGGVVRLKDFLVNDMYPAATGFVKGLIRVGDSAVRLGKKLEWLTGSEEGDKKDVLTALARMGPELARNVAQKNNLTQWYDDTLQKNPDLPARLKQEHKSGGGWLASDEAKARYEQSLSDLASSGGLDERLRDAVSLPGDNPQASEQTINSNNRITQHVSIVQQPGETLSESAARAAARIVSPFNGRNLMSDGATL